MSINNEISYNNMSGRKHKHHHHNDYHYSKKSKVCDESDSNSDSDSDIEEDSDKVFFDQNHIYFRCSVNMKNMTKLLKLITRCNNDYQNLKANCKIALVEPLPIYLHITTYGGDILSGFMIYDAIKRSQIPIYTVAEGYAISSGSLMLMGGAKKFATPNTHILMHQISCSESGTYEQLVDENHNNTIIMNKLKKIYLENTKMKSKDIDSLLKRDLYLDVEKCLNFGIIDKIYTGDN